MACPNFEEKTFAGGSKNTKFVNVFSLKSFPLYGTLTVECHRWSLIGVRLLCTKLFARDLDLVRTPLLTRSSCEKWQEMMNMHCV